MSKERIARSFSERMDRLNSILEKAGANPISSETFCILPFIHLSTTTDGEFRLCCRSRAVAHVGQTGARDLWSSASMNEIRRDLSSGRRRPECKACWRLEDMGLISLRQGQNIERASRYVDRIAHWQVSGDLAPPAIIELKLSNLCNLKCRMCSPLASTPWLSDWPRVADLYSEGERLEVDFSYQWQMAKREPVLDHFASQTRFRIDLEHFLESVDELEFAGGEPLLDPLHYAVLDQAAARSEQITLKYSTNLSRLGTRANRLLERWSKFKAVKLTVSVDGPPSLNEYIRRGTDTSTFEANLAAVRELANVELKASTCISAYNALHLRETFDYVTGLGMIWYANRVRRPDFLDARVWSREKRLLAVQSLLAPEDELFAKSSLSQEQRAKSLRTRDDSVAWLISELGPAREKLFARYLEYEQRLNFGSVNAEVHP